jgi:hypothetical protein
VICRLVVEEIGGVCVEDDPWVTNYVDLGGNSLSCRNAEWMNPDVFLRCPSVSCRDCVMPGCSMRELRGTVSWVTGAFNYVLDDRNVLIFSYVGIV